jgi:hypothetical protein
MCKDNRSEIHRMRVYVLHLLPFFVLLLLLTYFLYFEK